jgi:hypothetical protein
MLGWENLALAIKDKFEGFSKKTKNTKYKGKAECEEKKEMMRKEEYVEKVGKYFNFYVKQSDHTHFFLI